MQRILVLGSGQLGLMLAEAGARWGMTIDRLDIDNGGILYGSSGKVHSLDQFSPTDYDIITIEREHIPDTALVNDLRANPGWHGEQALYTLAHRRRQKALLDRLSIPTAAWLPVTAADDLSPVHARLGKDVVLKLAEGGYDGRGQWFMSANRPVAESPLPAGKAAIAEPRIDFDRELSVLGARNRAGQCVFYPLTENVHIEGILRYSIAPAPDSEPVQQVAEDMLGHIMQALGYEGVMAAELFIEGGKLLVNEIAPRVHNSGHWTQTGASLNQFQLHLLALMNSPLTPPVVEGCAGMINLVGLEFKPAWLANADIDVHWYGKSYRPDRKLGHVNLSAASHAELHTRLQHYHELLYGSAARQ